MSDWARYQALVKKRQALHGQYADCKLELKIIEEHPDLYTPDQIAAFSTQMTSVLTALNAAMQEEEDFAKAHPDVLMGPGAAVVDWRHDLQTNSKGIPYACLANISIILRHDAEYQGQLRYNLFSKHIEVGAQETDQYGRIQRTRQWIDNDNFKLASYLLKHYRMVVTSPSQCANAVEEVAHESSYDPILTWLQGLPPWDKEDRLSTFFEDYCEVPKDEYTQHCGRSLFLSLVARAYNPGCQVDTTIVLQGPEGARKTSLCRLLGGPWFREIVLSFDSKDFYQTLGQTWLGELAELDSFKRSEQTRIKAMLTTKTDTYRPSYGRYEIEQPRRAVFVGTTNDLEFLVDPHGGRRFFPITVGTINLDAIAAVLPQLFAEARDRFHAGESWWEESPEVHTEAVTRRENVREIDPWEATIAQYCRTAAGAISMMDILGSMCLAIPTERQSRVHSTRAGLILHKLGYVKTRPQNPVTGKREYVYTKDP